MLGNYPDKMYNINIKNSSEDVLSNEATTVCLRPSRQVPESATYVHAVYGEEMWVTDPPEHDPHI